jgi:hypothetical protein
MNPGNPYRPANVLMLVPVLFLFASCASNPDIVGEWREVGKTATIVFSADGSFRAIDNQGMAVSGKYTRFNDGRLRCEIRHEGGSIEVVNLTISVQGDGLTLTSSGSSEVESYRRQR